MERCWGAKQVCCLAEKHCLTFISTSYTPATSLVHGLTPLPLLLETVLLQLYLTITESIIFNRGYLYLSCSSSFQFFPCLSCSAQQHFVSFNCNANSQPSDTKVFILSVSITTSPFRPYIMLPIHHLLYVTVSCYARAIFF